MRRALLLLTGVRSILPGRAMLALGGGIAIRFKGAEEYGRWLVATGWAVVLRTSLLDYISVENGAGRAQLGLWVGSFETPWDWRLTRK